MMNTAKCRLDNCITIEDTHDMGKTVGITFRVTPREKQLIKAAARQHQQTMAFYARDTIMGDVRTLTPGVAGAEKLKREINRLIVLLQMARANG